MNKILHIISSLNVGGAEMMLYRLLQESSNRPTDKHFVISLLPKGELESKYQAAGAEVFMLDIKNKPFSTCKNIVTIIKTLNPMVIQTWMYHADFVGGILAKLIGYKNICWGIRNTHVPKGSIATYILMKLLALFSYFIPKKIVCVADSAKKSHINKGYKSNKMITIPNGYNFNHLTPNTNARDEIRKKFDISEGTLVIGCLGRFHSDKGQDLFIEAVAKFSNPNLKFMLVGRDCDWENEYLVNLIDKHNLRDAFILTGETSNVADYLSVFDVFCMPSRTEGFPNSLAEAMSLSLPCVGFNVGDANKLIGEGVWLVAENDTDELYSQLLSVVNYSEEQRKKLGYQASLRVKRDFSIENIYERYQSIYKFT